MDAEPHSLGVHRLTITIESDKEEFQLSNDQQTKLSKQFKDCVSSINFNTIDDHTSPNKTDSNWVNWVNILINVLSIASITGLSLLFPPSLPLTVGLTTLSFASTAFTARSYLINFYHNLRRLNLANMTTTVSLGWFLSLMHTLYHSITMPLASNLSMIFMSFIMPILLITVINGMDEIKRLVLKRAQIMQLKGMKSLFPQMAEFYLYYPLAQEIQLSISTNFPLDKLTLKENLSHIANLLAKEKPIMQKKNAIKEGMLLGIKRGDCFPVDCYVVQGSTVVDSSLLTGESQQEKQALDFIPAGAINLGQSITVLACGEAYNSTINKILFRANRAKEQSLVESTRKFSYFYMGLIMVSIASSVAIPVVMGIFTLPLLLQNVTGILFAVCPCTAAIAHQLPNILNQYQRNKKGIALRDENLCNQSNEIHTIVFDKTGTLTTGNSQVESCSGVSTALWTRVYLLEKSHGAEHPLAKAITRYYEQQWADSSIINDVNHVVIDEKNRGLSAVVQGKQIHIGNADFLIQSGIKLPTLSSHKLAQGFSPVYVAEDKVYQGVIYIKHEIRANIIPQLARLKKEGVKLIMLSGDSQQAAVGFNKQNGAIFDEENIRAQQDPQDKERFLNQLMSSKEPDPKGVWFIGDGLNDAPCARMVTEKGGISCAMKSDDKASFFTDISLDGTLDYVFEHNKLNRFKQKNVLQNQGLLTYGILAFLAFIISFSIAGIAVSPLIPLVIMVSTTFLVLFNSFRVQMAIDVALDKQANWLKQFLASDLSTGLLSGASILFLSSLLISTVTLGGVAFPALAFATGAVASFGSICLLVAGAQLSLFVLCSCAAFCVDQSNRGNKEECAELASNIQTPPSSFRRFVNEESKFTQSDANNFFGNCNNPRLYTDLGMPRELIEETVSLQLK